MSWSTPVEYPVVVRCRFCDRDLVVELRDGGSRPAWSSVTRTTGHAPWCAQVPAGEREVEPR